MFLIIIIIIAIIITIIILIMIICMIIIIIVIITILRECAAEQRTSSWLRARVAKGLRAAPLRQFRRANSRKVAEFQDQAYRWGCCAGISCVGCRKLAYSQGSSMPRELKMLPMGTRDSALRVADLPMDTREKKESLDR